MENKTKKAKDLKINETKVLIKNGGSDLSALGKIISITENYYEVQLMWNEKNKWMPFTKFTRKFSLKTLKAFGMEIYIDKNSLKDYVRLSEKLAQTR